MPILEIILIAVALSMDAFAVALCKGLSMKRINYLRCFIIAAFFGGFQFIMPLIGWGLGSSFQKYINAVDYYIVFTIFSLIGSKMIYDSFQPNKTCAEENFSIKEILFLAIGTSIDALAVGITFAMLANASILSTSFLIGIITFILSFLGVILGNKCGNKYKNKAIFVGGCIILGMGFKALFENLNIV